jgi:hypothetical protein
MARRQRWISCLLSILVAGTALATGALPIAAASSSPSTPSVRLYAERAHLYVQHIKGQPTYFDPEVLLEAVGGAWQIDASRRDYDHPIGAKQVIRTSTGSTYRPLPTDLVTSLKGMPRFIHVRLTDLTGQLVFAHAYTFCPEGIDTRVSPDGPMNPTYPRGCFTGPFSLGSVWGIDKGWALSAFGYQGITLKARNGRYHMRVSIGGAYASFFGVPRDQRSVTMSLEIKTGSQDCADICPCPPYCYPGSTSHDVPATSNRRGPLGALATQATPGSGTLPDLIALPAWGIVVNRQATGDFIDFSATIWDAGPAPLVVEGYRERGTDVMDAWQYFFRDGTPIGRARVGTMIYDPRPGHEHWHFRQFARYSLLDATQQNVVVSEKEAFCLAPTDAIDMTRRDAEWNPYAVGLGSACGNSSSIWIRESLSTGWGDTYTQTLPGQSLDITNVPNGTYFISVRANPAGLLFESDYTNDRQLRQIELGGRPGARTVTVEPWHGITV